MSDQLMKSIKRPVINLPIIAIVLGIPLAVVIYFKFIRETPSSIVDSFLSAMKKEDLSLASQYTCDANGESRTLEREFISVNDWKILNQQKQTIEPTHKRDEYTDLFLIVNPIREFDIENYMDFYQEHIELHSSLNNVDVIKVVAFVSSSNNKGIKISRNSIFHVLPSENSKKYTENRKTILNANNLFEEEFSDFSEVKKYGKRFSVKSLIRTGAINNFIVYSYGGFHFNKSKYNQKYCISEILHSGENLLKIK